jgi:hypothetical protein
MAPHDGAQKAAACAKEMGLHPFMLKVSPMTYAYIEMGLSYHHEYIDEEQSYLVLRTPERLLVGTSAKLGNGHGVLICRSPDVEVEVLLAF